MQTSYPCPLIQFRTEYCVMKNLNQSVRSASLPYNRRKLSIYIYCLTLSRSHALTLSRSHVLTFSRSLLFEPRLEIFSIIDLKRMFRDLQGRKCINHHS